MSPGRGPSPSHHVPAVRLRPGRCGSLQCQRGSAQGERRCQPSRGCRGGSRRAGARGPRRGTPGSGGPETAAAPRPAPVPGQHAPGGAAAASRGQRGRGPATRPCPRARPRPPELAPSSAPTAASCPSAAHLPGHHLRRRRRRRCSYRQISRDFAPPRAHPPPPTRTRRARTPAWKLQEAPCGPRGLHDLLLFSHPASTRAGGPEGLKPRCEGYHGALTWLARGACAGPAAEPKLRGSSLNSGCAQSQMVSQLAPATPARSQSLSEWGAARTSRPGCEVRAFPMHDPHPRAPFFS